MWSSGWHKVTEYIITSPENVMMNLNCTGNPDDQNILQTPSCSPCLTAAVPIHRMRKTAITVVTDDQTFPLPSPGWRQRRQRLAVVH